MNSALAKPGMAPLLAAGASLALFLAPWLMALMGTVASLFSPAPLAALYRLRGQSAGRTGLGLAVLAAAVTLTLMGEGMNAAFFVFYAAVAAALGEGPFWGLAEEHSVVVAAAAGIVTLLALALIAGAGAGGGIGGAWEVYWRQEMAAVLRLYQDADLEPAQVEALRATLQLAGRVFSKLGAGILVGGAILLAWGNLLLIRSLRTISQPPAELRAWRAPEWLVWVLIPSGGLMLLTDGFWFWVGANAALVLAIVYFLQGAAVLGFWLDKKNAPRFLRGLVYLVVAVEFFLAAILSLVGLFDLWFNFRRLGVSDQPPET